MISMASAISGFRGDQRRRQGQDIAHRGLEVQTAVKSLVEHGVGRVGRRGHGCRGRDELGAQQAAAAAHVTNQRMPIHHLPQQAEAELSQPAAFSTRCSSSMI